MKCSHRNADHLMPGEGWATMDGEDMGVALCEQFRCLDCKAWLSLGRSKDRSWRVRLDIHYAARRKR